MEAIRRGIGLLRGYNQGFLTFRVLLVLSTDEGADSSSVVYGLGCKVPRSELMFPKVREAVPNPAKIL